jgi:hypothetical protein
MKPVRLMSSRTAVYGAAVALPILAAAGGVLATTGQQEPATLPAAVPGALPGVAALQDPQTSDAQALGDLYRGNPLESALGLRVGETRRVSADAALQVHLIPTDRGYTCLAFRSPVSQGVPVLSCTRTGDLATTPAWVGAGDGTRRAIAVLVPDGYRSVTLGGASGTVSGNAAVITDAPATGTLTLAGPGRPEVTARVSFTD